MFLFAAVNVVCLVLGVLVLAPTWSTRSRAGADYWVAGGFGRQMVGAEYSSELGALETIES